MLDSFFTRVGKSHVLRFIFGFGSIAILCMLTSSMARVMGEYLLVALWGLGLAIVLTLHLMYSKDLAMAGGSALFESLWAFVISADKSGLYGATAYTSSLWMVVVPLFVMIYSFEKPKIKSTKDVFWLVHEVYLGATISALITLALMFFTTLDTTLILSHFVGISVLVQLLLCTLLFGSYTKEWFNFGALVGCLSFTCAWSLVCIVFGKQEYLFQNGLLGFVVLSVIASAIAYACAARFNKRIKRY